MTWVETRHIQASALGKVARAWNSLNIVLTQTITAYTDSGDGYYYLSLLDLRNVLPTDWVLYIQPTGGTQLTYKVQGVYELDEDGVPDESLAFDRKADEVVLADATDVLQASDLGDEIIPYLRIGIKIAPDTDATSIKFLASMVVK